MPVSWTIQFSTGPAQSLEEAGIVDITRTLESQAADTAVLTFRDAALSRSVPHPYGEAVRIFRDGVGWFTGRVDSVDRQAQGARPSLNINVVGPWWYFDHLVCTQIKSYVDSAFANTASDILEFFPVVPIRTSAILLNQDEEGTKIDTRQQIIDAVKATIAAFPAGKAPLQLGTVEAGVMVPREEMRDIVQGERITASLRWTPDLTTWFDYSTNPPRFNVIKRRSKTALNLDTTTTVFSSITLKARPDLVVSGVQIGYLRKHQRPSFEFTTLDLDVAGKPNLVSGLYRTFELYGSRFANFSENGGPVQLSKTNDAEALPTGIAARVYDSLNDLHYEGSAALVAADCPAGSLLGYKLNIANYTPESAGMNADIRRQIDTISQGATTLEVGPPKQLGAGDFVELLRAGRPVEALPVDQQGGGPFTPPLQPPPPATLPPKLQFSPRPPDVVVCRRNVSVFISGYGSGYGLPRPAAYDGVIIYADGDHTHVVAAMNADSISVIGSIVDFYGYKIGRGTDVDFGGIVVANPDLGGVDALVRGTTGGTYSNPVYGGWDFPVALSKGAIIVNTYLPQK